MGSGPVDFGWAARLALFVETSHREPRFDDRHVLFLAMASGDGMRLRNSACTRHWQTSGSERSNVAGRLRFRTGHLGPDDGWHGDQKGGAGRLIHGWAGYVRRACAERGRLRGRLRSSFRTGGQRDMGRAPSIAPSVASAKVADARSIVKSTYRRARSP